MMDAAQILKQLESLGVASYKKVLLNHGINEPVFGVKISELKKIQKRIKKDYQLSLDLFDTKVYDAQYLAGLIADETRMTRKDLQQWLAKSYCPAISETTVAWIAAESKHGRELALEWLDSKKQNVAAAGWATLSGLVATQDGSRLNLAELRRLLERVQQTIHQQPDGVRYAMNDFVIAAGTYVPELTARAIESGEKIGKVSVDMGNTSCQVPYAPEHIRKAQKRGAIGKKRKTARC